MDDMEKRFMDFLADSRTKTLVSRVARSLSERYMDMEVEDCQQRIYQCLLEKKDIWPIILAMPFPSAYVKMIVKKYLNDQYRSSQVEKPVLHFKRRLTEILRKSESHHTFADPRTKRGEYCYAMKSSGVLNPCHLTSPDINSVPFDERFRHPDVTEIKKAKRMDELASFFLDYWTQREGRHVAILIYDLWVWIIGHVNIVDVYEDKNGGGSMYADGELIETPLSPDEDFDPVSRMGLNPAMDPATAAEIRSVLTKAMASLGERERTCFQLWMESATLKDIALAAGFNGPSGVSYELENIFRTLREAVSSSGYSVGDENWVLEIVERYLFES